MARVRAVTLRLPEDLLAWLGEESARRGVTRDELVRRLLAGASPTGLENRLASLERRVEEIAQSLSAAGLPLGRPKPAPATAPGFEAALLDTEPEAIVVDEDPLPSPVRPEEEEGKYARRPGLGVPLAPPGELIARRDEEIEIDLE